MPVRSGLCPVPPRPRLNGHQPKFSLPSQHLILNSSETPAGGTVRLGGKGVPPYHPVMSHCPTQAMATLAQRRGTMASCRTVDPGLGGWFLLPWWRLDLGFGMQRLQECEVHQWRLGMGQLHAASTLLPGLCFSLGWEQPLGSPITHTPSIASRL